jgi:hypothetical protein
MEMVYYPYLVPYKGSLKPLSLFFDGLSFLCPKRLYPSYDTTKVKFIDPLPKAWRDEFYDLVAQYCLFAKTYKDTTFFEYLKNLPSNHQSEENISAIEKFLRDKPIEKEKKGLPKKVISALFLKLATEYRDSLLDISQGLAQIGKQKEETLGDILGTAYEIELSEKNILNLNYPLVEEEFSNYLARILRAFSTLIPTKDDFAIYVTDDEVIHKYLKNNLNELSYLIHTIYLKTNKITLWNELTKIPLRAKDTSLLEVLLFPYKKILPKAYLAEILIFPCLTAKEVFLWLTQNKEMTKGDRNGVFAFVKCLEEKDGL